MDGTTEAANVEKLTLNAGTAGNALFTGAVGTTRLGDLTITNANNVTESAGITARSLTQSAGQGTTLLTRAVNTNTASGGALTTSVITDNNTITTTNAGTVTFTNAGLLTLHGNISSDRAVAHKTARAGY